MFKFLKSMLIICIIVFIGIFITASGLALDGKEMQQLKEYNQGTAISYSTAIIESFHTWNYAEYPDWYGECYLDLFGQLVVAVKGNVFEAREKVFEAVKTSNEYQRNPQSIRTISFSKVKYSYRDLFLGISEIGEFLDVIRADDAYASFRGKVSATSFNGKDAVINIYFNEYDAELEKEIRKHSSYSERLRFFAPDLLGFIEIEEQPQ